MKELDGRLVLSAGGWDPRYAVTLAVASQGDVGAALIDSNGDGADIDLDVYERDAEGVWQGVGCAGTAFLSDRVAVISGRAEPGLIVDIEYAGQRSSIVASAKGWWLFVAVAVPGMYISPCLIGTRPANR